MEFRGTLKIIARILREVVNRVKLCCHHTVRCSHVEVQSHVVQNITFVTLSLEFRRTLKIISLYFLFF